MWVLCVVCMMDGCVYVHDRYVLLVYVFLCVACACICIFVHMYSICACRYVVFLGMYV